MYLSRLFLNQAHRDVRRDLADCREMHRTVLRAFPDGAAGSPRELYGILYRLEAEGEGPPRLYVQSAIEPDWSRLPVGYLTADAGNPACKPIDRQYGSLSEGMVLAFCLRANPTKKTGTSLAAARQAGEPRDNGQRVFLSREEDQVDWLRRKATAGGFELLALQCAPTLSDVDSRPAGTVYGDRRRGNTAERLTFGAVDFTGRLRITDIERFVETLRGGIGSGKAFGFGLLSLAPAGSGQ